MERRALIALALSFVVFMAFIYYGEKTKRPTAPAPATQTAPAPPAAPAPAPAPPPAARCHHRRPAGEGRQRPVRPKTWWWTPPRLRRYSPNWGGGSRASS